MGVAMQGTGKTAPDGDYIKYTGGAGRFVRLTGPNAGRNPEGKWVINPQNPPQSLRPPRHHRFCRLRQSGPFASRLRDLFNRLINHRLSRPAPHSLVLYFRRHIAHSTRPSRYPCLQKRHTTPAGLTSANFIVQDSGQSIKGKHIDIYLGEGQSAIDEWNRTGGNRCVDIYPVR